jgi:hypothetical protein
VAGSCEQGYELSGSIISGEFLDQVKDSWLPMKYFTCGVSKTVFVADQSD